MYQKLVVIADYPSHLPGSRLGLFLRQLLSYLCSLLRVHPLIIPHHSQGQATMVNKMLKTWGVPDGNYNTKNLYNWLIGLPALRTQKTKLILGGFQGHQVPCITSRASYFPPKECLCTSPSCPKFQIQLPSGLVCLILQLQR